MSMDIDDWVGLICVLLLGVVLWLSYVGVI